MKVIPESDMRFGQFEEMNLFHIENSQLYEKNGVWDKDGRIYFEIQ